MAIKLLGVAGEKLLDDEKDATTQDFVLIDHPVFFIKDVADYVPFMEDFRNPQGVGVIIRQGCRRAQAPLLAGLQVAAAPGHREQEARQPADDLTTGARPLRSSAPRR